MSYDREALASAMTEAMLTTADMEGPLLYPRGIPFTHVAAALAAAEPVIEASVKRDLSAYIEGRQTLRDRFLATKLEHEARAEERERCARVGRKLKAAEARAAELADLLLSALPHAETEDDDTLVALIRRALSPPAQQEASADDNREVQVLRNAGVALLERAEAAEARAAELEARYQPGHTDLMVSPEALDKWLPLQERIDQLSAELEASQEALATQLEARQRLEEALRFYAQDWEILGGMFAGAAIPDAIRADQGHRARAALSPPAQQEEPK